MKNEILKLVHSGGDSTILRNIFYEAALKFALESGAKIDTHKLDNTFASFELEVDGIIYRIHISKQRDGSTGLGVHRQYR